MRMIAPMLAIILAVASTPAAARNIVLTNDDGLTSNVVALYKALKMAGHDVIVSVPCSNQSGMGAALYFSKPVQSMTTACRNGAAATGAVGAGAMTRAGLPADDFYYVAGTPVMAALYGIDVVGKKRWGAVPDLVLSGPNEGQNVGAITLSSGTVSNAQYAALRGIPAVALSAGSNSASSAALDNPVSRIVAERIVELVAALDRKAEGRRMLPTGMALNVNFPDNPEGARWQVSRIGSYNAYVVRFSDNMAKDASPAMRQMAHQHGATIAQQPGIILDMNKAMPLPAQADDEAVVYKTAIAVSPLQAGYDAGETAGAFAQTMLQDLLPDSGE